MNPSMLYLIYMQDHESTPELRLRQSFWSRLIHRLKDWISHHKKLSVVLGLTMLALIGASITIAVFLILQPASPSPKATAPVAKKTAPTPPPKFYSALTGKEMPNEAITKQAVTAVMIENSPDARPQSGLKDAGVVFEAIAEGGITRFVALYQEAKPGLIGPVRSVRPYYVEWAASFDNSMAHIGGSARALQMIRSGNYGVDIDQFFNAQYYWRARDRYAPHNVYTNFEKLDALNAAKGHRASNFETWLREDGKKVATPNATAIDIAVSSGAFAVHYDYLPETNTYRRFHGGVVHTDRERGEITPDVVIAIKVPLSLGFEDGYREQINTLGTGQAYIFQNGTVTEAIWHKGAPKGQIVFKDAAGNPIPIVRGQAWITALAQERSVTWR